MKPAITIKNVTKTYQLYASPADRVKEAFHPFGKKYHRAFHALSNVSLDINRGETFGIVGRNGSGKSTLLQIVCGIQQASSGSVTVARKVSALLDLGAGFHREYTGRQNIFINGSILGFAKPEIELLMPQIESFADIGSFIDQPVKTYSKGMYVRLAFAIAINADPDILVIDEILAVGDELFQRKCFARIREMQLAGKTILLVTHNVKNVLEFCSRAALIDSGELLTVGSSKHIISQYQKLIYSSQQQRKLIRRTLKIGCKKDNTSNDNGTEAPAKSLTPEQDTQEIFDPNLVSKSMIHYESHGAVIENACIRTTRGKKVNILQRGNHYDVSYTIVFENPANLVRWGILIKTIKGIELGGIQSHPSGKGIPFVAAGENIETSLTFRCDLYPGTYFVNNGVIAWKDEKEIYLHRIIDALVFKVAIEKDLAIGGMVDLSVNNSCRYIKTVCP